MIDVRAVLGLAPPTREPPDSEVPTRAPSRAARDRSRMKRSFDRFVRWAWPLMTGAPYVENKITAAIVAALQDVADRRTTRLLICCPPGVGKSTLLACYAAWRLARDPGYRSIHAGHSYELAATESRRVRRLVENEDFVAMFPSVKLRDDENSVAHWATTTDGRYIAAGSDSGITGRRAHEAVLDDLLAANDRFSRSARDHAYTFLMESVATRLDGDDPPIIVVGQRLDRDDPQGRLIAAGGWRLVELPAEDEHGEPNAPNVLPREKLDKRRAESASTYACQYLQRPASDDDAVVKRSWWRFHRAAHVAPAAPRPAGCDGETPAVATPAAFDRVVIAVDMTFGSLKGDFGCAQVWGSRGGARYLLEQWRKKATQLEQQEAIKALARRYPTAKVLVEKAAGGAGAIEQLTAAGVPNIVGVSHGGKNKVERLGLVSPAIEGGHCYLPLGAPWLADFVEELSGNSAHDDAMDCASYALAELAAGVTTEWPEIRIARDRAERQARGETLPPEPSAYERAMHLWHGVPLPGRPLDPATKKPIIACQHEYIDGRCRLCGR